MGALNWETLRNSYINIERERLSVFKVLKFLKYQKTLSWKAI